jgi:excisionase family DNA binding protein
MRKISSIDINRQYFSTSEIANILGVSRIAIFKKIKTGALKAQKIGRNYMVTREELESALGHFVSESRKKELHRAVDRTMFEYGEAIKMLGKE